MKKHQFHKLCEGLAVHLPGFTVGSWLLIQAIDHGILRGFSCDPSEFDPDKFALVAFAYLCLCQPAMSISILASA